MLLNSVPPASTLCGSGSLRWAEIGWSEPSNRTKIVNRSLESLVVANTHRCRFTNVLHHRPSKPCFRCGPAKPIELSPSQTSTVSCGASRAQASRDRAELARRLPGEPESESPFSAPVSWNCIAPEADCEAKRTFAPKKPAFAEEKPGDSLPPLPRPARETLQCSERKAPSENGRKSGAFKGL